MKIPLRISLLDDHPAITDSYSNCISCMTHFENFKVSCFNTIEDFYDTLSTQYIPDIIFLDLSMPSYLKEKIEDGFHLAKILRNKFPAIKIIILTMHTSPLYIYDVIEKIRPEAFLIKSDADANEIIKTFKMVLAEKRYYSKTAECVLENVAKHAFCHDEINRNILLITSERYTNKDISEKLLISISTIEKRTAMIKQILNIEGQNNKTLIEILKKSNLM